MGVAAVHELKEAVWRILPAEWRFVRSGKWFLSHGEREVQELPRLVERGTVAVDIGANWGCFAYALTKATGLNGRVICIEPVRELAEHIQVSARQLGLPIQVVNCAVSNEHGFAPLFVPRAGRQMVTAYASLLRRNAESCEYARSYECRQVVVRTLDEICNDVSDRISFIKIDVEGHELEVLTGARATLRRHRPKMMVEIEQRHTMAPITETFEFIGNLGYRGEFLDSGGQTRDIREFDPTLDQAANLSNVDSAEYVNNFIFHPE
jgi:FkbM family methyltransferase